MLKPKVVMAEYDEQVAGFPISRFRLGSGLELLEQWADSAGQVAKNAMYKALFAISDGSVFHSYEIVAHCARPPNEFIVMVKDDLIVGVCVHDTGMFGISFIGRVGG